MPQFLVTDIKVLLDHHDGGSESPSRDFPCKSSLLFPSPRVFWYILFPFYLTSRFIWVHHDGSR